jgi:hypothetical protein
MTRLSRFYDPDQKKNLVQDSEHVIVNKELVTRTTTSALKKQAKKRNSVLTSPSKQGPKMAHARYSGR